MVERLGETEAHREQVSSPPCVPAWRICGTPVAPLTATERPLALMALVCTYRCAALPTAGYAERRKGVAGCPVFCHGRRTVRFAPWHASHRIHKPKGGIGQILCRNILPSAVRKTEHSMLRAIPSARLGALGISHLAIMRPGNRTTTALSGSGFQSPGPT